ncbi:MAG TPA: ATP-binding cassette domain-containing protein, partial [Candidatus Eisenbacteria bacterium]|nr:ATP-binding cassette domain-containing protein [Candidatus Eisenbacteria bacterium]
GPNGAGKTTTLRMLMGITAPDSGTVRYEGRDALDRARVGYLPEERGLFEDAPVLDTLAYLGSLRGMSLAEARSAGRAMLARLGLEERAKEKVNVLSKGNQQKVQFIGAVLHRPALAVLDEPFSGLDPINQELFSGLMRELVSEGTAVLLSAHQLDLVERLADRFLLISRGREVLSGTLDEMRRKAASVHDEVLRIDLASRDALPMEAPVVAEALAGRANGGRVESTPLAGGGVRLEVQIPRGSDLAPLLGAAGERGAIVRVETRRVPLHEIYLRAVREEGGTVAESEVTADA